VTAEPSASRRLIRRRRAELADWLGDPTIEVKDRKSDIKIKLKR
jgi:hypothetical protein